jgi:L-fuconolactonase
MRGAGKLSLSPVIPVVDAHQHFWNYGTYQTSWMEKPPYAGDSAFGLIRRSFGPADLESELHAAGVSAAITVEAADDATENETLLANAAANPWIAGVVGWVPLNKPDEAGQMLERLRREFKFIGVRHLINVEPDPDWIMGDAVIEGLKLLALHGLTFDYVGILPRHLEHVPVLAGLVPGLRIIIDHLGKPPIATGGFEPWASRLTAAAEAPNVFAKLSGLDAGSGGHWSAADLSRYVNHALRVFGPQRLMYGSDWPVSVLRGGYGKVWREVNAATSHLAPQERARIFGGTAIEVYRLSMDHR